MATADARQSAILRALADETRMRLVRLLSLEELSVQELCDILGMPQPKISRHLSVLRRVNLVRDHREGSRVYYTLSELEGDLSLVADYLKAIGAQPHPDLERLDRVLRQRTSISRDFAAQRAREWDELGRQLHSSTAALLAVAALAPRGLTVADLGTGTGLLLPVMAAFADTVYAVDHVGEMLEHARQRCADRGLTNVRFVQSDLADLATNLPEPCDALLLHFVLHQLSRPATILQALVPCLKPGGRIVIVERMPHEDEAAREQFGSLWLGFEPQKVARWLTAAGLRDVQCQPLTPATPHPAQAAVFVAAGTR